MKRIYDLTPEEVLALKDDQIRDYVNRELFENDIPISVLTLSVNENVDPIAPRPEGYFFKIGELNIGVYNAEDAMKISKAMVDGKVFCVDTMYYDGSYQSVYRKTKAVVDLSPRQIALYTKEEVERISKINKETAGGNDYKTKRDKALQIESDVYHYIHNVGEEYGYNVKLSKIFDDYLKIADGNKEMALKFLEQAYKFNDYTKAFIMKEKNMSIGLDANI